MSAEKNTDLVAPAPTLVVESERRPSVLKDDVTDGSKIFELKTDVVLSIVPEELSIEKLEDVEVPSRNPAVKRKETIQLLSLFFAIFVAGWDGGTYGPLLPRFQTYYDVNYTVVSMIFIAGCVGFIAGALSNVYMTDRLGFGKSLLLGSIGQLVSYIIMSLRFPFPVFCIAFFINGWAMSIQDAQANGYVAGLTEFSATKMGIMHSLYGLGAMISPFASTEFAKLPRRWSFHFVISLGLSALNVITILLVFRGRHQDECLKEIGGTPIKRRASQHNRYRQILSQKLVHLMASFSLVYVGVEITISGWTVSYLQKYRNAGPSAGYVSTGFFGGLTLGRVALLWLNRTIGEHRATYIYMVLCIGLELVVWLVPNVIAGAIAVSLVGFFMGPMYPILMNETGRLLPKELLTGSIGWIASFGFSGSALLPFITGALAEKFGIVILQPILIALMAVTIGIWFLVPDGSLNGRQEITERSVTMGKD